MSKKTSLTLLAIAISNLNGCGGGGSDDSTTQSPSPEAQFVVLTALAVNSLDAKQTTIISSQADYQAYWAARLLPSTPLPTVDFTKGQVLVADMGIRNSDGFSIALTSVSVSDSYVIANVKLTKPSLLISTALTRPAQVVFIPSRKEILVSEQLEIR